MIIWVDADACPVVVRQLVIKTAVRTKTKAVFVANQHLGIRANKWVEMEVVAHGFDGADDYIVEHAQTNDIAITSDIPLSAQLIEKQVRVLTPRGQMRNSDNIKQALNVRDFMDTLRGSGAHNPSQMGGQAPYSDKDKKSFANALNQCLQSR